MTTNTPATTATGIQVDTLRRGIEDRDAETLLGLYTDNAELRIVDREHPPSHPAVWRGRSEIAAYLNDLCARDMTHHLERVVVDDAHAAVVKACRYPDGTRVLCHAMLELAAGRITRESGVQAWDS